jgi:hypothetical protein
MALMSPASAAVTIWTLSDDTNTGADNSATASGTFTTGAHFDTSDITVVENPGSSESYTYTFTGPYDGPGWTQLSQMPPPACIIEPCDFPPTYAGFSLGYFSGPGPVGTGFEDTGQIATGVGTLTAVTALPEPATWAVMLLGVGMVGAGLRRAWRKDETEPASA